MISAVRLHTINISKICESVGGLVVKSIVASEFRWALGYSRANAFFAQVDAVVVSAGRHFLLAPEWSQGIV